MTCCPAPALRRFMHGHVLVLITLVVFLMTSRFTSPALAQSAASQPDRYWLLGAGNYQATAEYRLHPPASCSPMVTPP